MSCMPVSADSSGSVAGYPAHPSHMHNLDLDPDSTVSSSQTVALRVMGQPGLQAAFRADDTECSDSDEERAPVFPSDMEAFMQDWSRFSFTPPLSPRFEIHPPKNSIKSTSVSPTPRSPYRRRYYQRLSKATEIEQHSAKKARTYSPFSSPEKSSVDEQKTPRSSSEEPSKMYVRRQYRRSHTGSSRKWLDF